VADFIGDANLVDGRVEAGTFRAAHLALPVKAADGKVTATLRPERIRIEPGGAAQVLTATYLGSRMEYFVRDEDLEFLVSRPIAEPRFAAGQAVTLKIDPADLILVR
jgi:iron(III) transport system ATP-binding protein